MPISNKTKSERLSEVVKVLKFIYNLGLSPNDENIKKFKNILSKWVEDGIYVKGRIKLYGYEREILYELYPRQGTEIAVNMKYVKGL